MDKTCYFKNKCKKTLKQGVFLNKMWRLQTSRFIKLKCYLLGDCDSYSTNWNTNFDKKIDKYTG